MTFGVKHIYSNIAVPTRLNGAITNVATTLTVEDAGGWPSPVAANDERSLAAISFGTPASLEVVRYNARTGNVLSGLERGLHGTGVGGVEGVGRAHATQAEIRHIASAWDLAEFFMHQYKGDHYSEKLYKASVSGSVNIDVEGAGTNILATLTGNLTITDFVNVNQDTDAIVSIFIAIRNTGTAYSVTWPSKVKWMGGSTPTLSGINKMDLFSLVSMDGGATFAGMATQDFSGVGI